MKAKVDLAELEERLNSRNIEIQACALEESRDLVRAIVKATVFGITKTDNPLIYADRLAALGPVIIPDLELLWNATEAGETRTQMAILLLFLGSKEALADVLGALLIENPSHLFAASKLANAGVQDAVWPITNLLRAYTDGPLTDPDLGPKLGTLINSLKKLGGDIPPEIKKNCLLQRRTNS